MKRAIFPNDFLSYYPPGCRPCKMYVDLANRIYDRIEVYELNDIEDPEIKKKIAICAAIYFEDKMSGIGLWNAFVSLHKRMYGYKQPFFKYIGGFDPEEINLSEVQMLTWLVVSRQFDDRFLNPILFNCELTQVIFDTLNEEEEVEINEDLYNYIYDEAKAADYFKLKFILFWLRTSYLLCSDITEEFVYDARETFARQFSLRESIYYAETKTTMCVEIGPLALPAHEWLAEMYANNGQTTAAAKIRGVEYCQDDLFEITDVNDMFITLKSSKDEEYKTVNDHQAKYRKGMFVCTALVRYDSQYWEVNGVLFSTKREKYELLRERRKESRLNNVAIYNRVLEHSKGRQIVFFENKKQLREWLKDIVESEADANKILADLPESSQVAFASESLGLTIAPGIVHAIGSPYNPYYKKCDKSRLQSESMAALLSIEDTHPELLRYLLDKALLHDGDISSAYPSEMGKIIFTLNIDFIARNHRRHHYHAENT